MLSVIVDIAPHDILWWILVGLLAGAVASRVVAGKSYGCLANTLVGLAGAIIGGYIFAAVKPTVIIDGLLDQVIVAFIGAVVLLALLRLISPRHLRR